MKCPKCGRQLNQEEVSYAWVYICDRCGLVVLDFKLKLPKGDGRDTHNRR